jgi:hypothetical protein
MKIYKLNTRSKTSVNEQHLMRALHDLDARSSIRWTEDGTSSTAHWTFDGTAHHIVVNQEIVNLISNPEMLKKALHKRGEVRYVKAVHNHECAHALYTSRNFARVNALCMKHNVPFSDFNIFEDGRIEGLFRNRRPSRVRGGMLDIDHEGDFSVETLTYGVRKFDWLKWDTISLTCPRNAFLSFIKCEGTKSNLKLLEEAWIAKFGKLEEGFESTSSSYCVPYQWFLKLWRTIAGRGADKRHTTTESLLPLIVHFNKHFPAKKGAKMVGGLGGGDYVESAKKAGATRSREKINSIGSDSEKVSCSTRN